MCLSPGSCTMTRHGPLESGSRVVVLVTAIRLAEPCAAAADVALLRDQNHFTKTSLSSPTTLKTPEAMLAGGAALVDCVYQ